MMGMVEKVLR